MKNIEKLTQILDGKRLPEFIPFVHNVQMDKAQSLICSMTDRLSEFGTSLENALWFDSLGFKLSEGHISIYNYPNVVNVVCYDTSHFTERALISLIHIDTTKSLSEEALYELKQDVWHAMSYNERRIFKIRTMLSAQDDELTKAKKWVEWLESEVDMTETLLK